MFSEDVARGRGISGDVVRRGFGQGRLVLADAALKFRMVDRVATLDEVLARPDGKAPAAAAIAENRPRFRSRNVDLLKRALDLHWRAF
jgi:ClpP class serine protease